MSLQYDVPGSRFGAVYERVLPHDFTPGETDAEARMRHVVELEAEHRVAFDKYTLSELEESRPLQAEALKAWIQYEKQRLIASGVAIDDEMLVEAKILDEIIAEAYEDDEVEIVELAEVRKELKEAQHELGELRAQHSLAA